MIITREFLDRGMNGRAGISSVQLELIGAGYPPMKGWKKAAIGRKISDQNAELFLAVKGMTGREASKIVGRKRRDWRKQELKGKPFKASAEVAIWNHIKDTPLTVNGLCILDVYLDKLSKGVKLNPNEENMVKTIGITHRDKTRESIDGYVYMAKNGKSDKGKLLVKIGYSKNPKKRVNDMKTVAPKIELIAFHKGSPRMEKALHSIFGGCRGQGEWFHFDMPQDELIRLFHQKADEVGFGSNPAYKKRMEIINKWNRGVE